MSISEAMFTFMPFVFASSITSDLFLTYCISRRNLLKFLPFFIHCCFCCGYLHGSRHKNKFVNQIVCAAVNCLLFLQYGPHDDLVRILVGALASKIHASFYLIFTVFATCPPHPYKSSLVLQGMAGAKFSSCIINDFLELHILRVNEIDTS